MARDGDGSDLRWFEIPNGYVVHFLNSWEDGDRIVIDACRFDEMDFGAASADVPDATANLSRFTIDLGRGQATWERLGDLPAEFPRVNAAVEGRRHRYGYVASFASGRPKGPRFDSVTKYDLARGASEKTHVFGPGQVTGEAVFAPDPASTGEDDGWLLSLVHDEHRTKTDLVILDAHDMTETARIHMPRRVPYGFHANWLPDLG
jgi:carotenoid cleavage dioxygenase